MPRTTTLPNKKKTDFDAWLDRIAHAALRPLTLALLLAAALVTRIALHLQHTDFSYGTSVFGLPYSDAFEWHKLAESILRGAGMTGPWGGQRPGFPYLLASVYLWFGPSLESGAILLAICSALVIVLLYATGTRISGMLCGISLGAWALISAPQRA
jgi:hypothetical protein